MVAKTSQPKWHSNQQCSYIAIEYYMVGSTSHYLFHQYRAAYEVHALTAAGYVAKCKVMDKWFHVP